MTRNQPSILEQTTHEKLYVPEIAISPSDSLSPHFPWDQEQAPKKKKRLK